MIIHSPPPRWSLDSLYPSFDAPEYARDKALLEENTAAFLNLLKDPLPEGPGLRALINARDEACRCAADLNAYTEAVYTTDTRNARALAELNALETALLPLHKAEALFKSRLHEHRDYVLRESETDESLMPFRFFLRTLLEEARFQMSPEMEDLAADLARSGGDAWGRLQEAVSSTAQGMWDAATGERKTVTALRELAHDPDRCVRERAFNAEIEAWRAVELPLAAALNGVKGAAVTVDRRRGWYDGAGACSPGAVAPGELKKSAFQARLGEKTRETLIGALEGALPAFRRYLTAKARILGIERCAFYDLFAPLPAGAGNAGGGLGAGGVKPAGKTWTWEEAAAFITARFDGFDPRMGDFARRAFAENWIDAESRAGKVGGAYCTSFLRKGESRILCNFALPGENAGSFDAVTTVAHELGHAYHHEVIKDLPPSRGTYPMTLAETASIFAETIVFEGAVAETTAHNPAEKLSLIEGNLKDSCQVIVDILSRYYFEKELFARRDSGELSPAELCDLMLHAQRAAYGDALDGEKLHPYMWAVKSHYYSTDLAFYNYPYAFGLLFSLGLFARYQKEGPAFGEVYRELLRLTGSASVEDVARSAGFNIEEAPFWQDGIAVITRRIDEFEKAGTVHKETL
jgi:pepF/M3 family oligoendopeptidase